MKVLIKSGAGRFLLLSAAFLPQLAWGGAICPTTIENDPAATADACGILLTVDSKLAVSVTLTDTGSYDGGSSSTFGVINDSGVSLSSLTLMGGGAGITLFANNGIRNYVSANGVPIPAYQHGPNGYEDYYGPATTYSSVDLLQESLSVAFTGELLDDTATYFSLPGDPETDFAGLTGPSGDVAAQGAIAETPEISNLSMIGFGILLLSGIRASRLLLVSARVKRVSLLCWISKSGQSAVCRRTCSAHSQHPWQRLG
jgi:hypothetical protein